MLTTPSTQYFIDSYPKLKLRLTDPSGFERCGTLFYIQIVRYSEPPRRRGVNRRIHSCITDPPAKELSECEARLNLDRAMEIAVVIGMKTLIELIEKRRPGIEARSSILTNREIEVLTHRNGKD